MTLVLKRYQVLLPRQTSREKIKLVQVVLIQLGRNTSLQTYTTFLMGLFQSDMSREHGGFGCIVGNAPCQSQSNPENVLITYRTSY